MLSPKSGTMRTIGLLSSWFSHPKRSTSRSVRAFIAAASMLATSTGLDLSLSVVVLAAFPAVLLGGLDSIPGALVGGLIIGLSQGLVSASKVPIVRSAAEIMPFVVLLIVLLIRPEGLFGQKRIERI